MAVRKASIVNYGTLNKTKNYKEDLNRQRFNFNGGDSNDVRKNLYLNAWSRQSSHSIRDVYPTGFHNLPVRVLLLIFHYFNEYELRRCLMPVCRKWKRVAQLPELWQNLRFHGHSIPPDYICQQIRVLPHLQSVHLFNIPDVVTVIRQLCRCVPRIVSVGVRECSHSQPDGKLPESVLRNLINSCKKLREIDLKGTQFSGSLFYLEVAVLPDLRSINLSNNRYVNGKNLIELVLNCRSLEELKLTHRFKNQNLSDNDILYLFLNLRRTIRALAFDGIGLPDASYKLIAECKNLEKLMLYNAMNMSSESLLTVAEKLPKLECLKIQKLTVPAPVFVMFFRRGASTLQHLTVINFADCWKLDNKGLDALCKCCRKVEKLNIKNCKEITSLNSVVELCKQLCLVNIAYCTHLPENNVWQLAEQLPQLKHLAIDMSSEQRRQTLTKINTSHPDIEIHVCLSEFNKTHAPFNSVATTVREKNI